MKTSIQKSTISLILFLAFCFFSYGQTDFTGTESLATLTDTILKQEIISFTKKGETLRINLYKPILFEVPIQSCSNKEVYFSSNNTKKDNGTFLHLYFKEINETRFLDSIFVVTHSHFHTMIPKKAYQGLTPSGDCSFSNNAKKDVFYSPSYKAFYSVDKKRLYMYMRCDTLNKKSEVTWVIMNGKYYTRIMDEIND